MSAETKDLETEAVDAPAARSARSAGIGSQTRSGFLLLATRSLVSRVLSPISQIVLARLLMPEDYGVISLAYTVTTMAAVLQTSGVREILIRRHITFRRWQSAAFWMALSLGILSAVAILVATPWAASFYHNPMLVGILASLAVLPVVNALSVVPQAALQSALQFRAMFWIDMLNVIGVPLATIVCALLGLGAYSFVVPQLVIGAIATWRYWRVSGLSAPWRRLHWRRWAFLWQDIAVLLGSGGLLTVAGQVDRIVLGRMTDAHDVGIYYFAFAFAVQTIQLFSGSVVSVLLPALAVMQGDPVKQRGAFERATAAVAYIAVPLCLLQGVLAEPIFTILFGTKWLIAVPLVQVMCLGTAFDVVSSASHAAIRAQGRFRIVLLHALVSLMLFTASGVVLTSRYGISGMAWAFVLNFAVCTPMLSTFVYRPWRGGLLDALKLYLGPLALSLAAGIPLALAWYVLLAVGVSRILSLCIASVAGVLAYAVLLRLCRRDVWGEAVHRVLQLLRKVGLLKQCQPAAQGAD